jgi:hypothetical protein
MMDEFEEAIKDCTFLLEPQKKKMIELWNDYDKGEYAEDYATQLIDSVLRSVLDFGIDDLSTQERVNLQNAINDFLRQH